MDLVTGGIAVDDVTSFESGGVDAISQPYVQACVLLEDFVHGSKYCGHFTVAEAYFENVNRVFSWLVCHLIRTGRQEQRTD